MLNVDFILETANSSPRYQIINGLGQVVLEGDLNEKEGFNTTQLNAQSLAEGAYILQLKTTAGSFQRKFVKR